MRIIQAINSLSAGGAESVSVQLAIALKQAGHEVEFFSYVGVLDQKGEQLEAQLNAVGIRHRSSNARTLVSKLFAPVLLAWRILVFRPDVVHTHLEQSDLCAYLASFLTFGRRVKYVRTLHNVFASKVLSEAMHRRLARFFNASVACGRAVFERYPYQEPARLKLVENGIDLSRLPAQPDREGLRARFGWSTSDVVFINVGALGMRDGALQKAQDVLIEALAHAACPGYKLVFLGDGECRQELEMLARSKNVAEQCVFAGRVSNPYDYIAASDVVVMPSRFEGLSIAAIEAACMGKPLVLTDIPSFESFRAPASVFVAVEDAVGLRAAMDSVAAELTAYELRAGDALPNYRLAFDIREVAKAYLKLYGQC